MNTFKIEVTKEHIEKGRRGSCKYCPIALAAQDVGFQNILVEADVISGIYKQKHFFAWLPSNARKFIYEFDSYYIKIPKPITIELKCDSLGTTR